VAWMQATFQVAQTRRSAAVMFIAQGNPGWDLTDGTRAPLRDPKTLVETDGQPEGYHEFLSALRDEVIAFRKPVAYVHGDSHYFRVDKPLQARDAGSKTSPASRRLVTTRGMATTTCSG